MVALQILVLSVQVRILLSPQIVVLIVILILLRNNIKVMQVFGLPLFLHYRIQFAYLCLSYRYINTTIS